MLTHWNKTITLFIRSETDKTVQWEKFIFSRCFFKHTLSSEFDEKSRINGESFIVRIPLSVCNVPISQGSIAVLGNIPDDIEANASGNDILRKYPDKSFKVNTVSDNTEFYTPHIRIGN